MSQSVLTDFEITPGTTVPYPVPFPDDVSEGAARSHHRTWYWSVHEYETYECPDCERGIDTAGWFEVHHIDENPRNGDPDNLLALCGRCHRWRHSSGPALSGLSLEEWKEEFANITESEFGGGASDAL